MVSLQKERQGFYFVGMEVFEMLNDEDRIESIAERLELSTNTFD